MTGYLVIVFSLIIDNYSIKHIQKCTEEEGSRIFGVRLVNIITENNQVSTATSLKSHPRIKKMLSNSYKRTTYGP